MEESAACSFEVSTLTKQIWRASGDARIRRAQCCALHLRCLQIEGYILAGRAGKSTQEFERRGGRAMLEIVRILRRALKLVADSGGEHWLQRALLRLEARDEFRFLLDDLEEATEALIEATGDGEVLRYRYLEDRCFAREELQSAAARDRAKLEAKLERMATADPVSEHALVRLKKPGWSSNSPLHLGFEEVSWESGVPLGKGASGTVYRADWLGYPVAVKLFKRDDYSFQREVEAMGSLADPHPHVLQMIGVLDHNRERERGIVMELMRMDLRRYLDSKRGMLLQSAVDLLLQIARAMRYLHDHNVLHRDLKPHNVLVGFDDDRRGSVSVALTDFGVARIEFDTVVNGSLTDRRGTPRYMAPEMMVSDIQYSRKVDVYSFAVLCSEVLTGMPPFHEEKMIPFDDLRRIVSGGRRPRLPDSCPEDLRALIDRCWSADPQSRPLFPEIEQELARIKRKFLQFSVAPPPTTAISQSQSSFSTSSSSVNSVVSTPLEDRASLSNLPTVEELRFHGAPEIGSEIKVRFQPRNGTTFVICRWIREGDNGVADHHEEMKPVLVPVSNDDRDYAQLRYVVTAGDYKKRLALQCLPLNSQVRTGLMARESTPRIRFSRDLKESIENSYKKGQAIFQLHSRWWESPGQLLINRKDYLLWYGQGNPNNHRFTFLDSGDAAVPPPIKLSEAGPLLCNLTRSDGNNCVIKFASGSSRDKAVLTLMYFWERRFDAAARSSSRE